MPTRVYFDHAFHRLAAVVVAACLGVGCQSAPKQSEGRTFRVMTYNIHHGEGLDGKVDLQRIADLLRREGTDLVALQEVDKGGARTAHRDFPVELAALTGLTCVFSNNHSFQSGEYGNAVLTRLPVKLATHTHYVKVNETGQRGLLQLTLDVHGRAVAFLATHLDHRADDAARWSNVGEIEEIVRRHAIPLTASLSPSDGERVSVRTGGGRSSPNKPPCWCWFTEGF